MQGRLHREARGQPMAQVGLVAWASGHLAESRAASDRRVPLVTRTASGDATLVRFAALMADLEGQWRDAAGPRRHATFREVLVALSAGVTGSAGGSSPG